MVWFDLPTFYDYVAITVLEYSQIQIPAALLALKGTSQNILDSDGLYVHHAPSIAGARPVQRCILC